MFGHYEFENAYEKQHKTQNRKINSRTKEIIKNNLKITEEHNA